MIPSILNSEWLRLSRIMIHRDRLRMQCPEEFALPRGSRPSSYDDGVYQLIFTFLFLRYTHSVALLFTFSPVFCIVLSLPASCGLFLRFRCFYLSIAAPSESTRPICPHRTCPRHGMCIWSLCQLPRLGEAAYLPTNAGQYRGTQRLLARPY